MSPACPHIVVAGAGIGGLTLALALSRVGCRVDVVERTAVLTAAGAGLQLSPNASRVLRTLGLLDRLRAAAVEPQALRLRRGHDGRLLALAPLGTAAEARWGAPMLVVHRADLQSVLLDAVGREASVKLTFGAEVFGFEEGQDGVRIRIGDGPSLDADLLVGADGLHSRVRQALHGLDRPLFPGRIAWRAMIPANRLPDTMRRPETNLWLGSRTHLVHYPLRGGSVVNVVAITEGDMPTTGSSLAAWERPGDEAALAERFRHWCPAARDLLAAATEWRVWTLADRAPLRRWSSARVTLLGDAAHPMLPFLAQGAAQAIEDAAVLAEAVADAPGNLQVALAAYDARRVARATRVQRQSRQQGRIYHLAGPAAVARDTVLRLLGPKALMRRYDWLYEA